MLIKGNSPSYRCPLHLEQSRWEQNWTCSPKPSSISLSWTHTLFALQCFLSPAHGTTSVTVPKRFLLLMSTLLALDCTELMLLAGWSAPGQSFFFSFNAFIFFFLQLPSSGSPDQIWPSWTQLFSIFPWKHLALNQALPPAACLDAVLEHGRSPVR